MRLWEEHKDELEPHRLAHNLAVVVTAASFVYEDERLLYSNGQGVRKVAKPSNKPRSFHEHRRSRCDSSAQEVALVHHVAGDTLTCKMF